MRGRPGLLAITADGTVILEPAAVPMVLEGLRALGRERRSNGTGMPAAVVEVADWMTVAAELATSRFHAQSGSAGGTSEVPRGADRSQSLLSDLVDVKEAAGMLKQSPGYVRRLCRRGAFVTADDSRGPWRIDRAEVVARRSAQKESV